MSYRKGARAERELRTKLEDLGYRVYRVAGSRGVDLVLGGVPIEVKLRRELSRGLEGYAGRLIVSRRWAVGGLKEFFQVRKVEFGEVDVGKWEALVPECGILALRVPRVGFILIARRRVWEKLSGYRSD